MFEHAYFSPGTRVSLNNLLLNDPSSQWLCTGLTGLGRSAPRAESGARVNAHGSWATKSYLTSRVLELEGSYHGTAVEADGAISDLLNAVSLEDFPLTIYLASGPITFTVRANSDVKYDRLRDGWVKWNASVIAHDPFGYLAGAAKTLTVALPVVSGGLTLPALVPWFLNSSSNGGEAGYYNNYSNGRYSIRIDGAVQTPRLVHITDQGSYTLRWDLELGPGEWLDIDPQTKVALLNGESVRAPSIRQWSQVGLGNNTWRLRADAFNGSARATIKLEPAL